MMVAAFISGLVVCALMFAAVIVYMNRPISRSAMLDMTVEGDRIVAALEQFVEREGRLPTRLDELTPQDLPQSLRRVRGWRDWEVLTSPDKPDPRRFVVIRKIDGGMRRLLTGHGSLKCDAEPFGGKRGWVVEGGGFGIGDTLRLK